MKGTTVLLALTPRRRLSLFLWLVMLHSLAVGAGLVFSPAVLLHWFGFAFDPQRFFVTQGGAFHFVMGLCYGLAASDVERFDGLVILSICAKTIATVFLLAYYFLAAPLLVVLLSGIGDGLMGLILFLLYRPLRSARQ